MKKIVVSAINFDSGGPLSIMKECLETISKDYSKQYEVIALVHSKKLYKDININFKEYPISRRSWFFRLFFEYVYFYFLSLKLKPDFWLSMHDITPSVRCNHRFVYCHNPSPFNMVNFSSFFENPKTYLFSKLYKNLYSINIKKNKLVIVQQDWIRDKFINLFGIDNILVAYPEVFQSKGLRDILSLKENVKESDTSFDFFYPSFPRPFKNFELVCEAYSRLPKEYQNQSKLFITIERERNNYSKKIFDSYSKISGIKFLGLLSREEVFEYYAKCDCMVFPSRLETWGLPITEFKLTSKPMLLADCHYAKETLGDYEKCAFFDVDSPEDLKDLMISAINRSTIFKGNKAKNVAEPFTQGWHELMDKILEDGTTL